MKKETKLTILKKAAFCAALLAVAAVSIGPLSAMQKAYNSRDEDVAQQALTKKTGEVFSVWLITRTATGVISLFESVEVGVNFGVQGSVRPMEILSGFKDVLNKLSDICFYAASAIAIEKILLASSGYITFRVIIPVCAVLCVILIIFTPVQKRIKNILLCVGFCALVLSGAVPLSVHLSSVVERNIFHNEIGRTYKEINKNGEELTGIENSIEKHGPTLGKAVNSIFNFASKGKQLVDNLVKDIINYILILIVTNFVFPLITILFMFFSIKHIIHLTLSYK
ncbi:MAG: hypothetical protein LBC53_07620 [Spirochaetaceae bacterium]|jgi:hypothetical protein|nr:hypothetical protein [Spirochaetaceae bacterium]